MLRRVTRRLSTFSWRELEGVFPEDKVQKIRASVSADLAEVIAAPKDAANVDWGKFARNISTPGVVDTIKKNYEAANKADDDLLKQDVTSQYLGENFDKEVKLAEEEETSAKHLISELGKELEKLTEDERFLLECSVEEWIDKFPEVVSVLEKEMDDEVWDEKGRKAVDHCTLPPDYGHH
jgi:hypothetical protein